MDDDDDNMVDDFDLNLDPLIDPPNGIEDRLRLLVVVTSRARQTRKPRGLVSVDDPRVGYKRDFSHVAKALEIDVDVKKKKIDYEKVVVDDECDGNGNGNLFDCNLCLKMACDPVLTCCGHMFCWGCFYLVPYVDSVSKECPVCKGEVLDSNVTPIYGNGDGNEKSSEGVELDYVVKVPPRPRANRVEGDRQQCFGRELAYIPMADAIRRIRVGLGLIEENALQSLTNVGPASGTGLINSEAMESREGRHTTRVMSGNTASLSSIFRPAALTSEDLQNYVRDVPETVDQESDSSVAFAAFLHMATLTTDDSVEVDQAITRPRRRRGVSRVLSLEGPSSTENRRRRFR